MTGTRIEHDSMGDVEVPADALWGAQTQRAVDNFPVSGERIGRDLIGAVHGDIQPFDGVERRDRQAQRSRRGFGLRRRPDAREVGEAATGQRGQEVRHGAPLNRHKGACGDGGPVKLRDVLDILLQIFKVALNDLLVVDFTL